VVHIVIISVLALAASMGGCPAYNVWQQGMEGQAALAKATQDRQIKVQEAVATKESATMLAQAEVERAKGVAQANQIIGNSLHNNEDYLRYLFVNGLENTKNQVIYVPTEANLPILEATRRVAPAE
jgi:regulator of protease activity HflC (stomatin/prohibitin superfamily)